jgi:hypothetical protein
MGAFAAFCSAFIESITLYTPAILPKKKGCRQPFLSPQNTVLN